MRNQELPVGEARLYFKFAANALTAKPLCPNLLPYDQKILGANKILGATKWGKSIDCSGRYLRYRTQVLVSIREFFACQSGNSLESCDQINNITSSYHYGFLSLMLITKPQPVDDLFISVKPLVAIFSLYLFLFSTFQDGDITQPSLYAECNSHYSRGL